MTVWLPLVASAPLQLPEAVQPVAFAETQVKVAVLPTTMEFAEAVRVAVGVGAVTSSVTDADGSVAPLAALVHVSV